VEASILAAEVVEARIKEIEKEFCNGKITWLYSMFTWAKKRFLTKKGYVKKKGDLVVNLAEAELSAIINKLFYTYRVNHKERYGKSLVCL
jgi:fumarylacetoacetate (FAA) hydrolase family protein